MNITRAIITKSIRFPVKITYKELDVSIDNVAALQSPPGISAPIIGIIRSVTSAVTNFVIAAPITNATASPITPYLVRNH